MSRSGYSEDCDDTELNLWRGAVNRAIKGKRGQRLLRDLVTALDAMPVKRLVAGELQTHDGDFCALGIVGAARGVPVDDIDPDDTYSVACRLDIASALAREVVYINDELGGLYSAADDTPEGRWKRVRKWAAYHITEKRTP